MEVDDIRKTVAKLIKDRKDPRVSVTGVDNLSIGRGQNAKIIAELYLFVSNLTGRVFLITNETNFDDYFTIKQLLDIYKKITGFAGKKLADSTKNALLLTLYRYAAVLGFVKISEN